MRCAKVDDGYSPLKLQNSSQLTNTPIPLKKECSQSSNGTPHILVDIIGQSRLVHTTPYKINKINNDNLT